MLNECSNSTATDSMTARLRIARYRIMGNAFGERNPHRIIALTEFPMACYGCTIPRSPSSASPWTRLGAFVAEAWIAPGPVTQWRDVACRSEERRVGKECRTLMYRAH